jgi:transposase-like protein
MLTLNQVSALSEDEARETLECILWPDGPVCPHCGALENLTRLQGKAHRTGVFQCNNCHDQFTVTVNTIFEDSHIPLRKWLMAFTLVCSAKKGISALQLQRELELGSYRTAWHVAHRIRHAMSKEPLAGLLRGTVEVDETYVGGKPRPEAGAPKAKPGRGTKKTPVVALVERGGKVRARKVERVDGATLKAAIRSHVDRSATIMTDEWPAYRGIGTEFAGGHPACP